MNALLLLIICLLLGVVAKRAFNPPQGLAASINWWIITIALPALVLHVIPQVRFTTDMWYLVVSQWLVFAGSWLTFVLVGSVLKWPRQRIGGAILVCGLGNTVFMAYPMIEALRGHHALALASIADQLGCFVMMAIGGAVVTATFSSGTLSAGLIVKRIVTFPPFIATLVGLAIGAVGGWPRSIDSTLSRIGDTLVPLALFSVGLQVRFTESSEHLGAVALGLLYKLALAPLFVFGLGAFLHVTGMTLTVSTLQAAMAPSVSATIMAEQHDLEPRFVNLLLVAGIVLSFLSVPFINSLI